MSREPAQLNELFNRAFAELTGFPIEEIKKIIDVLEGGEFLIALENLTTQLCELDVSISGKAGETLRELAHLTGLDSKYLSRLGL